jgi:OCT family organic cation transporter-like MFS transporter 4/5
LAKCSVYVGSLVGFLLFSYLTDNYGRKLSLLVSIAVCVVGNILVSSSFNIVVASIGLFLSGGGANSSANTTLCFFNEVTNNYKRQKYSILVQFSFTIGAILVTGFYYIIPHWRVISVFLITIPSLISIFMVFFYVE